ncbi:SDR family NAD(P)-dependent oxidoreductase [Tenacibaculum sp. M341]|uniref:SDR family NAD(P)-dependent oxidoreductase n=1 Tax=Tenacibaculum sp. M341 TaxID=2530339 RepID=UPI0010450F6A|nr:SDR family NAD(P)-dependent oxidoreductase [Tenacibaculum sp. M341]TCI94740.1 SDR family NAD(P)-dependent oxidoreductase [Tenacibaculum sp. M341]
MDRKTLVTGANGHLGFNLCKLLIDKKINVVATYRNKKNKKILEELGCETAHVDIMDKESMIKAFKDISDIYAVGASFKMWAKNPKKEIYDTNVTGTKNLFEAAATCGVKNIVYVSSVAALDFTKLPAKESNGYNSDRRNWYYNSKNDSDKLALELSKKFNIRTVLILPSAMIGSKSHNLSYSNKLVHQIMTGEMIADTNITLNWIDVKDVAIGAYLAMKKGKNRERYILANEKHTSIQESVHIVSKEFPDLKLKTPPKIPKFTLHIIAFFMEIGSKLTGKEPLLKREYIKMFYGLKQDYDIHKAKTELGFNPTNSKTALINAVKYLKNDWNYIS